MMSFGIQDENFRRQINWRLLTKIEDPSCSENEIQEVSPFLSFPIVLDWFRNDANQTTEKNRRPSDFRHSISSQETVVLKKILTGSDDRIRFRKARLPRLLRCQSS